MLDEILLHKREEVAARKSAVRLREIRDRIRERQPPRKFEEAIGKSGTLRLIAEIKKASPSKGIIREAFDPVEIARIYQENGASALSVLTDTRYFQGHLELMSPVREAVDLPVLQKDFVLEEYQVYEARAFEADAILLITAVLEPRQMADLHALALDLGMAALCEVHTEKELESVLDFARIIGINNRDLTTFQTDLETTFRVLREVPEGPMTVSESGIETRDQIFRLQEAGVDAILVGESLMRSEDIGKKMRELMEG